MRGRCEEKAWHAAFARAVPESRKVYPAPMRRLHQDVSFRHAPASDHQTQSLVSFQHPILRGLKLSNE